MEKIKISAVSYTNTKPFIYGLQQSELINHIELSLDIPSDCAQKLIDNQVDIGLIPVASIPFVPNAKIISSFCIGSIGAVNSVFIFSDIPMQEIRTLTLDLQSRTSNLLAKVLLKFHFKVEVKFITDQSEKTDAMVLIGDRTFGKKEDYKFAYDMGEEWMNFTGLPFVYAAWVANKQIPESFIFQFDQALKLGITNRYEVLKELPRLNNFDLEDYLFNKLNFDLTDEKRKALNLFLNYIEKLN